MNIFTFKIAHNWDWCNALLPMNLCNSAYGCAVQGAEARKDIMNHALFFSMEFWFHDVLSCRKS